MTKPVTDVVRTSLELKQYGVVTAGGFETPRITQTLNPGALVLLTGRVGSGKTLICEALVGIVRPGCQPTGTSLLGDQRASELCAFVPQDARLAALPTDHVASLMRQSGNRQRGLEALDRLRLERDRVLGLTIRQLASGERRRVLWALALAQAKPVLVADGFGEALDASDISPLRSLIAEERQRGTIVLLATRDEVSAELDHDTAIGLDDGDTDSVVPLVAKARAPARKPVITVDDLVVPRGRAGFLGRRRAAYPVDGATLELHGGECHVLLGPSGSGKTTLLEAIAGVQAASQGRLRLRRQAVAALRTVRSRALRRRIQLVFQDASLVLDDNRTVRAHLLEAASLSKAPSGSPPVWLERLGLSPRLLDLPAGWLSAGEAQRVDLARSLVLAPDVVLLDEPRGAGTNTDDGMLGAFIQNQKSRDIGFLVATSSPAVARSLGDRVSFMVAGRIVESGPRELVLDSPAHPATRDYLTGSFEALATPRLRHAGCPYAPYCSQRELPRCAQQPPETVRVGRQGRSVRQQVSCFHPLSERDGEPASP